MQFLTWFCAHSRGRIRNSRTMDGYAAEWLLSAGRMSGYEQGEFLYPLGYSLVF
jgi:hypothetical protein